MPQARGTWRNILCVNSAVRRTGRCSPDNLGAVLSRARLTVWDDLGRVQRVSSSEPEVRNSGPGGAKQIRSSSNWERKTAVASSKISSAQTTMQLTRFTASTPLPLCNVKHKLEWGFPHSNYSQLSSCD